MFDMLFVLFSLIIVLLSLPLTAVFFFFFFDFLLSRLGEPRTILF